MKALPTSLISTQSVALWCAEFYTALCFVNQRNYKTLETKAQALTRTRYFLRMNLTISHSAVYKEGLGYLSLSYVLQFRGLLLNPLCVFVTIIQVRSYFASTVIYKLRIGWQSRNDKCHVTYKLSITLLLLEKRRSTEFYAPFWTIFQTLPVVSLVLLWFTHFSLTTF
jgi:hypothetical protein